MKFSKDLLELRDKENKLVRMKRYEEAEKIKMKADLLEEFERNKLEAEVIYQDPCVNLICLDVSNNREKRSQVATLVAASPSSPVKTNLA